MTGIETAVLRTAGAVGGWLYRSRLGQVPGAGLADRPVRPGRHWQRPAQLGEAELRRLAEGLAERLGPATARLPQHERLAALAAVADAFAGLGPLDADTVLAADFDPAELAARVRVPPGAGLSAAAEALCWELIRAACAHAADYLTTLPSFGARADVELVRRAGELQRTVDRLADRADGAALAFEERYAAYVAQSYGRLQLFGLTLGSGRREWPLDLAYISLAVSAEQHHLQPGEPGPHPTTVKAERALGAADRVLLRGPAGSGKSTLLQWLAVHAARREDGPWRMCVPFVLRLRSFTTADALPLPEDFLKAGGVPLAAPPGWVEELMLGGRALVLVDGVDEVPQRLRGRTETWLRSLVSAFPKARYVVTTRPSAVPEDWLAGQGFVPHALLPMEREDVGAFIAHWHTAARAEAGAGGEDLDAYEASLREAVSARRDLGRLATNPLMCALLCALNRDRRMHLPRARKELYDAALDMLLVRRDTEREIGGVEGVYLTRDEQILLLQRFAYWLIRNGQVEAGRDEAVELVAQWLDAMPQVREQGDAERVFAHLLIRSGLLREPVKGSVDFVHRTFQDYLGAKAAVESRDFGVLVRNAHDDTWDDVVRMAVGHARPDERARVLRGLLKRADRVKGARSRLVLLAAASLEHAPELDPSLRGEIQSRTAELLPPRTPGQAEELAKAGELVLELLPDLSSLGEAEAAATVRTAALLGGDRALEVIAAFRRDDRYEVGHEIAESWGRFPTGRFADAVLTDAPMRAAHLHIRSPEQLDAWSRLPHIRRVHLTWEQGVPPEIARHRDLEWLVLQHNKGLRDLSALAGHPTLRHLGVFDCPRLTDIGAVADMATDSLAFGYMPEGVSLAPLAGAPGLRSLVIGFEPMEGHIGDVPADEGLTKLVLWQGARRMSLRGLERWPLLESLTVSGDDQYRQLVSEELGAPLRSLQIRFAEPVDAVHLVAFDTVSELMLLRCTLGSLAPLRGMPRLSRLRLAECAGVVDLSPLAGSDRLRIEIDRRTTCVGTDRIPPERLTYF
ncbi:NACHT domain-containing NTPase [Streptomyces sp. NRRL S-87]|uniref:NACHT domain-containing protein n=1 Tax=Streptomyces sp. NRRL S-87 TaxID=1463920 RepID=UPI0004BF9C25|nr:NACHT domain-containing protein [Streptomyces sp. NRRL S-87]